MASVRGTHCHFTVKILAFLMASGSMRDWTRFMPEELMYRGTDSQLMRAYDSETGCKVVIKQAICPESQVFTEIGFLRTISHQHVIKPICYDMYEGVLVLPLAHGGDLFSVTVKHGRINEDAMRKTVYQILQCLKHIHALGITHNDIKPDNILVRDADYTGDNVILSDFGLSEECDENRLCHSLKGTMEYSPPEKIRGLCYSGKADIWSLGVMTLTCLLGIWPFDSEETTVNEILDGLPILETSVMDEVSGDACGILLKMLQENANKRISASQALKDPWFTEFVGF